MHPRADKPLHNYISLANFELTMHHCRRTHLGSQPPAQCSGRRNSECRWPIQTVSQCIKRRRVDDFREERDQEEKKKMFAQLMPVNANHVPAMVITSKTPLYHPLVRQLEHPILARLVQTWQDDEALYFGSELCAGGSLQVHS